MSSEETITTTEVTESERILLPPVETQQLDIKKLIETILGFTSLGFLVLSLFFPYWNSSITSLPQYISLWQLNDTGIALFHWDVIYYFFYGSTNFMQLLFSIVTLSLLVSEAIIISVLSLKRKFPGTFFFTYI